MYDTTNIKHLLNQTFGSVSEVLQQQTNTKLSDFVYRNTWLIVGPACNPVVLGNEGVLLQMEIKNYVLFRKNS